MKARIFRAGMAVASLALLVSALGADKKWR